jgi:prevent-host-death family protein
VKTVNIQAAKTHLSRLVDEAVAGEEIILARAGKPMVRLTPLQPSGGKRKLGILRRQGEEHPDCWKSDPGIVQEFEDNPLFPEDRRRHK